MSSPTGALIIWTSAAAEYWAAAQTLRDPATNAAARRLTIRELERLSARPGRPAERARALLLRIRARRISLDSEGATSLERALVVALIAIAIFASAHMLTSPSAAHAGGRIQPGWNIGATPS